MARILLASGCEYTAFNVSPKNWRTVSASTRKPWYITYRFYDPDYAERWPSGYQVMVRGMNSFADVKQRKAATEQILTDLKTLLEIEGYNPIREIVAPVVRCPDAISPYTPVLEALATGASRLRLAKSTLSDINVTLRGFSKACKVLRLDAKHIKDFMRKDVIAVLDQCEKLNTAWSPARYNKYKANLSMVWTELLELEAVESNPMRDIKKRKGGIKKLRQTLTSEERSVIDKFLRQHYPSFWRLLHIFFHSGARETELLQVQGQHVNLEKQQVLYLVKKGLQYEEKLRPIKDIALPFWQEALKGCGPEDFVFSKGLLPGPVAIAPRQITRRWAAHVKDKKKSRSTGAYNTTIPRIGIKVTADFYSLKHSNLDEVEALLDADAAAALAGHTTTKMVEEVYAVGRQKRKDERLRKVANPLA